MACCSSNPNCRLMFWMYLPGKIGYYHIESPTHGDHDREHARFRPAIGIGLPLGGRPPNRKSESPDCLRIGQSEKVRLEKSRKIGFPSLRERSCPAFSESSQSPSIRAFSFSSSLVFAESASTKLNTFTGIRPRLKPLKLTPFFCTSLQRSGCPRSSRADLPFWTKDLHI